MSEAYQETREISSHHMLQGNDLLNEIFWLGFFNPWDFFNRYPETKKIENRGSRVFLPELHRIVVAEVF